MMQVKVAGQLVVIEGRLQSINLHSGHYRPREDRDLLSFLDVLEENGVDLGAHFLPLYSPLPLYSVRLASPCRPEPLADYVWRCG